MTRVIGVIFAAVATLVISFILTNVLYIKWAVWRYPDTNSMAGMSACFLGLIVARICALIAGGLVFWWPKKDSK